MKGFGGLPKSYLGVRVVRVAVVLIWYHQARAPLNHLVLDNQFALLKQLNSSQKLKDDPVLVGIDEESFNKLA